MTIPRIAMKGVVVPKEWEVVWVGNVLLLPNPSIVEWSSFHVILDRS